jgi:hypothetical protein
MLQPKDIKNESFQLKNMSEYEEDAMARLVFYYNRWGLTGNKNILRCMLGREPMSVEDYIVRSLNEKVSTRYAFCFLAFVTN